ncbi:MAG: V-type ATP synthase subunit A [Oscillospiraceae bacterium]|nr:V-type ATP synthase subunit A [Oscillospiraceae bacterium]
MCAIHSINGPVIKIKGKTDLSMLELVYVGKKKLAGEVIAIDDQYTTIQIYESATGLSPGEPVSGTGAPLTATLGPGILSNIYDGIQRPLLDMAKTGGAFIESGASASGSAFPLDLIKKYEVKLTCKQGDILTGGDVYAECPETPLIVHRCMLKPGSSGEIIWTAQDGKYAADDVVAKIKDTNGRISELTLCQKWPIRSPRPVKKRMPPKRPLITGQRVIDTLFPIAKGGTAAVPGGFGTGKTMIQHQIAKWCDADIIIYIGCGERGNEMTQVLEEFFKLKDPRTGSALTDRTVLIANTSNMPVAAREASIYTGVTLAEYYRDMGYHAAIMADSTSRWAEALREISGRLEEMPAEEGFPAYLPSRLAEFYERAGYAVNLNGTEGSVTLIGAVSPQGADFSEPVTQNTKRFVRCFWALDKNLAYSRHYPAINWITSYSDYLEDLSEYYEQNAGEDFLSLRSQIMSILSEEASLMEIVKLIGADVLPDDQKLIIEIAKMIRTGFLQQNAFKKGEAFVVIEKQRQMMADILERYKQAKVHLSEGKPLSEFIKNNESAP